MPITAIDRLFIARKRSFTILLIISGLMLLTSVITVQRYRQQHTSGTTSEKGGYDDNEASSADDAAKKNDPTLLRSETENGNLSDPNQSPAVGLESCPKDPPGLGLGSKNAIAEKLSSIGIGDMNKKNNNNSNNNETKNNGTTTPAAAADYDEIAVVAALEREEKEEGIRGYRSTKEGGWWRPDRCRSLYNVALIIPYRDRARNLRVLLHYLHPMLQRQLINYRIFVAEQDGNGTYNKGRIMNSAFNIVRSSFPQFDCFIFHDVDMVPEDDRNMYACSNHNPRHLSPAVNTMNYALPYKELIGGVLAIKADQFVAVNGYANVYWGWGGEDDDMYYRIKATDYKIARPRQEIGRYTMLPHAKRTWISHSKTYKLLGRWRSRQRIDGVNNVKFELISLAPTQLYTHLLIRLNERGPSSK